VSNNPKCIRVHEPHNAIIAMSTQELSCDNGICYVRDYDFDAGMDEEALRELIKAKIKSKEETGAGLARLISIHPTAFSKWLNDRRRLQSAEADKLRRYFNIKEPVAAQAAGLPIYNGLVPAGGWAEAFDDVIGYMPSPDAKLSKDAFVIIVEGDSMNKHVQSGEAIIVDPQDRDLVSGKLYVVRNAHGEVTFKRYQEGPSRLVPCSTNASHQTIYPGQEEFQIIGRVRKRVSDL